MTELHAAPVHLTRCDPNRNMARFYHIALAPTLFGEVALIRTWGRIGTDGRARLETFGERDQAVEAGTKIVRAKQRRGYSEAAAVAANPGDPCW